MQRSWFAMKTLTNFLILFLASLSWAFGDPQEERSALIERMAKGSSYDLLTFSDLTTRLDVSFWTAEYDDDIKNEEGIPLSALGYIKANREICPIIGIMTHDEFEKDEEMDHDYLSYFYDNDTARKKIEAFVAEYNKYVEPYLKQMRDITSETYDRRTPLKP